MNDIVTQVSMTCWHQKPDSAASLALRKENCPRKVGSRWVAGLHQLQTHKCSCRGAALCSSISCPCSSCPFMKIHCWQKHVMPRLTARSNMVISKMYRGGYQNHVT